MSEEHDTWVLGWLRIEVLSYQQGDHDCSIGEAEQRVLAIERALERLKKERLKEPEMASALLSGRLTIDDDLAEKLGQELGPNKEFWVERERLYRGHLLRLGRSA